MGVCCYSPGESDKGTFGGDGGEDIVFYVEIHTGDRSVDLFESFADFFFWRPVVGAGDVQIADAVGGCRRRD